jgi:hypothetical protein
MGFSVKSSEYEESKNIYHGCYLLTANGFIRAHNDAKQDMKRVPVRFN